jgi:hypothetical protein
MDFTEQNILFLKGIHMQDIVAVEDIYQKELLNNIDNTISNIVYDKICKQFTKLEDWKKSTNIRCWFCSLKFKNIPWFIIENTSHSSDGIKYNITGNFCSCGCLLGFVLSHYNKREHFDVFQSVKKLYKIIYNKTNTEILPSPSKFKLKIYGGDATIDEYQTEIKKINEINIKNGKNCE